MSMVIHERIHTDERPFSCKTCGARFRCHGNLTQHESIHNGERPFMCQVCGKLFSRPDRVRIHMRIHTGEKPYACPICSRRFTQKGDMVKHTKTHKNKEDSVKVTQIETEEEVIQVPVHSVSAWLQTISDGGEVFTTERESENEVTIQIIKRENIEEEVITD